MKNITIKSVEQTLTYRGIKYVMCPTKDIKHTSTGKEFLGYKTICATMKLHKSLIGVRDLYGNFYKGSQFLYVSENRY